MRLAHRYEFINNLSVNLYFTPIMHISVSIITIWIDFLLYIYMTYFIHYLLFMPTLLHIIEKSIIYHLLGYSFCVHTLSTITVSID